VRQLLLEAQLGSGAAGAALTLVFFLCFVFWIFWAWNPRRRESIEAWSKIPFDGGEP
jgi:cbb3-type cytochrome oxidase subunit 3